MTIIEQLHEVVKAADEVDDLLAAAKTGAYRVDSFTGQPLHDALCALPLDWEQQLRAVEREAVLEGERRIDAAEARVQSLEGALGMMVKCAEEEYVPTGRVLDDARAALAPKAEA